MCAPVGEETVAAGISAAPWAGHRHEGQIARANAAKLRRDHLALAIDIRIDLVCDQVWLEDKLDAGVVTARRDPHQLAVDRQRRAPDPNVMAMTNRSRRSAWHLER